MKRIMKRIIGLLSCMSAIFVGLLVLILVLGSMHFFIVRELPVWGQKDWQHMNEGVRILIAFSVSLSLLIYPSYRFGLTLDGEDNNIETKTLDIVSGTLEIK